MQQRDKYDKWNKPDIRDKCYKPDKRDKCDKFDKCDKRDKFDKSDKHDKCDKRDKCDNRLDQLLWLPLVFIMFSLEIYFKYILIRLYPKCALLQALSNNKHYPPYRNC